MRKLVAAAAVVAALSALAVGCTEGNPGAEQSPSPSVASPSAKSGPVTLRFAVYGAKGLVAAYREMAEAFTSSNPQVRVRIEHSPDAATATQQLESQFLKNDAPDVFLTGQERLPDLVAKGRVQPLDALLEERAVDFGDGYQRDALEAFSEEAALQCMPSDVSPLVVYYNKSLVDPRSLTVEDGDEPPTAREGWDWEQFSLAARRAARGRPNGLYIEPDLKTLAPFVWSGGADLVDDLEVPTSLTLSSGDSMAAIEEVLSLLRDPDVSPSREQLADKGAIDRFKQGQLGMVLGTRALLPELRAVRGFDFDVFPLPSLGAPATISSISGYCMSSGTEDIEAAADFIAFAVSRQGATITGRSGYVVPSNVEVAHSRAFNQPGKQPANAFLFSDGIQRANETPFVAEWPQVIRETRPLLDRMFYAPVIDLEALLTEIDARSQRILAPEEADAE